MNDILIKVDDAGRIIIPLKVRKQYGISKNDTLLLTTISNGFKLQKEDVFYKYQNFFSKIKEIEHTFNLNLIVASSETIIYTSKKYKNLKDYKISNEVKKILNNNQKGYSEDLKVTEDYQFSFPCYYMTLELDSFTKFVVFITFSEKNKKEASFIIELLS